MWAAVRRALFGPIVEERAALTLEQVLREDGPVTRSGVTVSADRALQHDAVWACCRLLADAISSLPVDAYRDGSREPVTPKPAILMQPAAGFSFAEWCFATVFCVALRGTTFGLITARSGGALRPAQIDLLNPDAVVITTDPDTGAIVVRINGRKLDEPRDLWMLRGWTYPGELLGMSPIRHHAESIGLGLAAQGFGATLFGNNDGIPAGVLSTEQALNQRQAEEIHQRWKDSHGGRRGTAVMGNGVRYQSIAVAPEDSQFLETRRYSVQQIARIYGIPVEMIGGDAGNSMTYANVTQRDLSLLRYAIGPWVKRLEDALTLLLPRGTYAKFNTGAFLRADLLTRYQAHEIGLRAGFLTVDEVRALEDLEPLREVS